jgi:ubiquinone biosynthesis protein
MDEARTLAIRCTKEALAPTSIATSAGDEIQALLPMLRRLPRRLDRITEADERGSLTVKVRLFADARDEHVVTTLASRAIVGFLGGVIGLISVLLLGAPGGPLLVSATTFTSSLSQIIGYLGLCVSIALIMRVVTAIFRDRLI